uniref:Tripartite motif-containing protein 35 n=1 Tax=Larimichthys crocea TaxID=215358 RepID=A0A0F8ACD1_LARCR
MKVQFKKLHQFLEKKEEAMITALKEEEEQMMEKTEALSRETATEDKLRAEDVSFLQNYKAVVPRIRQRPLLDDTELPLGALIEEAKYMDSLNFNVKMKDTVSYVPAILDLKTSSHKFLLSGYRETECS